MYCRASLLSCKRAGTPAFEKWRRGIPQGWPVKVALAAGAYALDKGAASIGIVGFCMGGGQLVDVLATAPAQDEAGFAQFRGGVSFYGTRIDVDTMRQVQRPLKLLIGAEDPLIPPEQQQRLREVSDELCERGVFSDMTVFKNEGHAFAHQEGKGSDSARYEAQQQAVDFLAAIL